MALFMSRCIIWAEFEYTELMFYALVYCLK